MLADFPIGHKEHLAIEQAGCLADQEAPSARRFPGNVQEGKAVRAGQQIRRPFRFVAQAAEGGSGFRLGRKERAETAQSVIRPVVAGQPGSEPPVRGKRRSQKAGRIRLCLQQQLQAVKGAAHRREILDAFHAGAGDARGNLDRQSALRLSEGFPQKGQRALVHLDEQGELDRRDRNGIAPAQVKQPAPAGCKERIAGKQLLRLLRAGVNFLLRHIRGNQAAVTREKSAVHASLEIQGETQRRQSGQSFQIASLPHFCLTFIVKEGGSLVKPIPAFLRKF